MHKGLKSFCDIVTGQVVYVIGGGPSVNDIDLSLLENKLVICINKAFTLIPTALRLYWGDSSWASKNFEDINAYDAKFRFTSMHGINPENNGDAYGLCRSIVLHNTGDFGIDTNICNVKGNNSGAQVLNLLANARVSKIVLLGYDAKMVNKKSHWHSGYGFPMSDTIYKDMFIPCINSMADPIKELRIKVVNVSLISNITVFEKDILENNV